MTRDAGWRGRPVAGRSRRRARTGAGPAARVQRAAAAQLAHRLVDLLVDRPLQHQVRARVVHGPGLADDRRAPRLAPGPGAELGRADPGEALRRDGRPPRRVDLAGVAEALGHRQDGRQGDLGLLGPVVVLELEAQGRAEVLQAADPAGEGEIEQLGHLGPHLPRLAVDGVAAEEHEVEGAGGAQRGGQGACAWRACPIRRTPRRRRAAPSRRPRPPPRGARPRRSVGRGSRRCRCPRSRRASVTPWETARRQYAFISRSTPAAHQPPALEAHRLGDRDLLDERGDAQRGPRGAGDRDRAHGGFDAATLPATAATPRLRAGRQRPMAAPSGLRGSDAADQPARPVVGPDRDDLGAADGDGVEGADPLRPVAAGRQPVEPPRWRVGLDDHREVVAPPEAERPGRGGVEREPGRGHGGRGVLAGVQQAGQELADDLWLGVAPHGADEVRERPSGGRWRAWGRGCGAAVAPVRPRRDGPRRARSPRRGCGGRRPSSARRGGSRSRGRWTA